MISRRVLLGSIIASSIGSIGFKAAAAADAAKPVPARQLALTVPVDYFAGSGVTFQLPYLVDGTVDQHRPTILVVGDGQQFYIRPDVLPTMRAAFGQDVNLVGLPGRSFAPGLQAHVGVPHDDGWLRAYQLLRHRQWTADIDALRQALVGRDGHVLIYGGSGGGRLTHEYLLGYPHGASHAYTEAAVAPAIEAQLGLLHDRFWAELPAKERATLASAVKSRPEQRPLYVQLLQRQNFFVDQATLPAARARLIADIATDNRTALAGYSKDYQVDAIRDLMATPVGAGIVVREFEFIEPLQARIVAEKDVVLPDLEVSANIAAPLLRLQQSSALQVEPDDWDKLTGCMTQATVVAGRYDHIADYRGQISLASRYPHHELLLLSDDHVFGRFHKAGSGRAELLKAWPSGLDSVAYKTAVEGLASLRWHESADA